ncbi:MAG: NAD(P)H-dependent oxidoreductase [Pseudomonadota bacterium]
MRAHIVLAHPEPRSFNAQLAALSAATLEQAGWQTSMSDLYSMGFDPVEGARHFHGRSDLDFFHTQSEQRHSADQGALPVDVGAEIEHIEASELVVVHFPLWWFGAPAMFKGWMDRVFVYGKLYRSAQRYDRGTCAGKRVLFCVTTGASAHACAHNGREGDTALLLWPLLFPFRYLGFEVLSPVVLHGVGGVAFIEGAEEGLATLELHRSHWVEALEHLPSRATVPYNPDADFDETTRLLPSAPTLSPFIRQAVDAVP